MGSFWKPKYFQDVWKDFATQNAPKKDALGRPGVLAGESAGAADWKVLELRYVEPHPMPKLTAKLNEEIARMGSNKRFCATMTDEDYSNCTQQLLLKACSSAESVSGVVRKRHSAR